MSNTIGGRPRFLVLVGIFCLFITGQMFTIFTPGINVLAEAWSSTPIDQIYLSNTITGLAVVPFSIIGGAIADKVGYKLLAAIGSVVAVVAGVLPFFMTVNNSFIWIIMSRVFVGVGAGIVNPLGGALIMRLFSGITRAKYLGYGNLFFMIGGVIFQTLGGVFASIGWNYLFLANLFALIPLLFTLIFVPKIDERVEAKLDAEANETNEKEIFKKEPEIDPKTKAKRTFSVLAGIFVFFYFIIAIVDVVAPISCSMVLDERSFGGPIVAAMASNLWLIGGAVTSVVFGFLVKIFDRKLLAILCAIACIGFFIMFASTTSAVLYFVGMGLGAFADSGIFLVCQDSAAEFAGKNGAGLAAGLMMAAMNLGAFIAGYYITGMSNLLPQFMSSACLLTTAISLVLLTVIATIIAIILIKRDKKLAEA